MVATGVFPFTDVGVVTVFPLSRAVVLPDGGFLVTVVGFTPPVNVLETVVVSGFDDVPAVGFAIVGVVEFFTDPFVVSTFAFVAEVVVLRVGGLFVVVVGFVVVTVFFGSGF